ncbi:NAD+ synthase (glutamine-hydrolysing) [Natranaerovirga pectinivora]|uniref:Glutamine-dependent NAD(+) synthetase n=1 Tax=Natranaerovirga pectinivora TaxID=682400 RepID=A0A4V2V0J0_9FIRM|nr:NAD(+) synthase [Natranaerovirga pectinivora]TCT16357.1 NAD+ synthase (glutamine-hydrolysing) [Natranaerovirga pectinivora]
MHNYNFIRVGSASPTIKVADIKHNEECIINLLSEGVKKGISLLTFPELCITGYTCQDLFHQNALLEEAKKSIERIREKSTSYPIFFVIGAPLELDGQLYNCLIGICEGKILGIVPKTYLPTYSEFYELRWFTPSKENTSKTFKFNNDEIPFGTDIIFVHSKLKNCKIAIDICEDLWAPIPPSSFSALSGATIILNGSASNDIVGKSVYRKKLIEQQSARTVTAYIYASSGYGESTTDVVFGGHCMIYENGKLLKENTRFTLSSSLIYEDIDLEVLTNDRLKRNTYYDKSITKDYRQVTFSSTIKEVALERQIDPHPFVPKDESIRSIHCEEIFSIQTLGLAKRLEHIGCNKVVIGISGGLDSTLALLVCVKTFDLLGIDRKNIIAITMPGFGTTDRTYNNALSLMKELGVTQKEISIKEASLQQFKDIGHDPSILDVTYENVQARGRTQILMNLANKENGIVIGTGDLSELALGWATYNGDHMSMYGVNGSIPKTLIRYLIDWVSSTQVGENTKAILLDVLDTPVSPELLPPTDKGEIQQKTEEVVGPYELHDFFLYNMMRYGFSPCKVFMLGVKAFENIYSREIILKWLKKFYYRFFSQQFKRSCLPDGPKVGSICLSPRGDWRMPSDAVVKIWIDELESIN